MGWGESGDRERGWRDRERGGGIEREVWRKKRERRAEKEGGESEREREG